ncbi:MAG TPA: hypothetical protein VIG29_14355, partial [Vicinamibacteria bacterium]
MTSQGVIYHAVSLSDDLLADPDRLGRLRAHLDALVREYSARAGFLVDEEGTPFAATGNVEFRLPHPLAGFLEEGNGDAILAALVGESPPVEPASAVIVERLSGRALLVLV